jgi:hypothetical protein
VKLTENSVHFRGENGVRTYNDSGCREIYSYIECLAEECDLSRVKIASVALLHTDRDRYLFYKLTHEYECDTDRAIWFKWASRR